MYKMFKKLFAIICANLFIFMSLSVYAAPFDEKGDISLENQGKDNLKFDKLVVPTIDEGTYNFTLDPQGLLNTYNPEEYDTPQTMYFKTKNSPASIEIVDSSVYEADFYYKTKVNDDTHLNSTEAGKGLKNAVQVADSAIVDVEEGFYLWVPDASSEEKIAEGAGRFESITKDNINHYYDIIYTSDGMSIDSISAVSSKTLTTVTDGHIYRDGYLKIDTDYISDHITLNEDDTAVVEYKNIYKKKKDAADNDSAYSEVKEEDVTLIPPTNHFTNKSNKATIVNKSSVDKTVRVKVNVLNGDGLHFADSSNFTDHSKPSIYLAIADDTPAANEKPVLKQTDKNTGIETFTAILEFDIEKPDFTSSAITYMMDKEDSSNEHRFLSYLKKDIQYNKAGFFLTGATDGAEEAKEAWDMYAHKLRISKNPAKPSIEVIYEVVDKTTP